MIKNGICDLDFGSGGMGFDERVEIEVQVSKLAALDSQRLWLGKQSLRVHVEPDNRAAGRVVALVSWLDEEVTCVVS